MNDKERRGDAETRGRGEKEDLSLSNVSASPRPRVSASSLRVFCAVELPARARERAAEHAARLRERFSEVRASWPRAENLHLTLKFLGEIEEGRAEALSKAAGRVAEKSRPFKLSIEGAGAFPTARRPARALARSHGFFERPRAASKPPRRRMRARRLQT